jgi:hypothetical protein
MLRGEIEENFNYTKVSKTKKIAIRRTRIEIEIKHKLKDNYNFFIEE